MTPLPAYFAPVNSADTATAFLSALQSLGLLFHPEDDPFDCLAHHNLPKADIMAINSNMAACFAYLPDPCESALDLLNA